MKGGQTPIHIQRWAPADYQQDEHILLLLRRRAWGTLTFYRQFLDVSFIAGGDLPASPEALAAVLHMPRGVVVSALAFCLGRLLHEENGRLFHSRVRRDVADEIEFRASQAELGREGGKLAGRGRPKGVALIKDRATPFGSIGPPSPTPTPTPSPTPTPAPAAAPSPSGKRAERTSADPPLAAAGAPWVDHDPGNDLEVRLVARCEELAARVVVLSEGPGGIEDRLDVLSAVTTTPKGKSLTTLRGASRAWLEQSLRACDDFERDLGEPPAVAPAEGA